jgi:hypothetical protein
MLKTIITQLAIAGLTFFPATEGQNATVAVDPP